MAILSGLMLLAGCDIDPVAMCNTICGMIPDFLGADCGAICGLVP
jgi:hypothetical protein